MGGATVCDDMVKCKFREEISLINKLLAEYFSTQLEPPVDHADIHEGLPFLDPKQYKPCQLI
jgi:hypothetical protein